MSVCFSGIAAPTPKREKQSDIIVKFVVLDSFSFVVCELENRAVTARRAIILLLHSFSGYARKFANRAGTAVRTRTSPWANIVSNSQIIRVALDYVGLLFRHCRTNSKTRKAIRHNCEISFLHLGAKMFKILCCFDWTVPRGYKKTVRLLLCLQRLEQRAQSISIPLLPRKRRTCNTS